MREMMSDNTKQKAKEKAITEFKRFVVMALYLWVLLSIFELHRYAVLRQFHLVSISGYRIGFAGLNALIIAKVILAGQALHVGEQLSEKRAIFSVLFMSACFAVLVVLFEIVEEVIVGLLHGRTIAASMPQLAGGGAEGMAIVALMIFVVLLPFFLFLEVQRVIGREKLLAMIFQKRTKARAA
jgi:hypothetical protein